MSNRDLLEQCVGEVAHGEATYRMAVFSIRAPRYVRLCLFFTEKKNALFGCIVRVNGQGSCRLQ
jgi:hypothetical protein